MNLGIGTYLCNPGTHICGLYKSDFEHDTIIFEFLTPGYKDSDHHRYSPVERTIEQFCATFTSLCSSYSAAIHDPDHFTGMNAKSLYYPFGILEPRNMYCTLDAYYVASQIKGRRTIRAIAEMAWVLEAVTGVEHLMAYEARLNYFIPGMQRIRICIDNVNRFPGAAFLNVFKTHFYIINCGIITQNPLCIHSDKGLADIAPQFPGKN
jgi:hypothetical protein